MFAQTLPTTENYIYSRTYLEAVTAENPSAKQIQEVNYFDGLGKIKQKVSIKSTPSGGDLVLPLIYDDFGRNLKKYLPLPQSTLNGGIHQIDETDVNSYYSSSNAYFEKELESFSIGRVKESAFPGEEWKKNSGHTVRYNYDVNVSTDNVKKYSTITNWDAVNKIYNSSISYDNNYGNGDLYKYIVTNEDNNTEYVFKDNLGHIILIRKNDGTNFLDTYYVYNEYNQLAYIIPPLASVSTSYDQNFLDKLCYQYKYDDQNRLVEKKIPGKNWEYMVYDKQDRLIMTQEANLKGKGVWFFTKYDQFGRVIYTGLTPNADSRQAIQNWVTTNASNPSNNESRSTTPLTYNGIDFYYTNMAIPYAINTLLSVNYYDSYPVDAYMIPTTILGQNVLQQNSSLSTKGLATAAFVKNIEDDNWTKKFVWYDTKGRIIGDHTINHLGGYTRRDVEVDFAGAPQRINTYHAKTTNDVSVAIQERFTYDEQNRLFRHYHKVDDWAEELLTENTYNNLSQIINKKVGNGLQSIDYTFNIRNWLTGINAGDMDKANLGEKLFSYKIKYTDKDGITNPDILLFPGKDVVPKYNGNIAEIDWRSVQVLGVNPDMTPKRYGYAYDQTNKLLAGYYQNPNNANSKENTESLDYDLNGNITKLYRTSVIEEGNTPTVIDKLQYIYEGGDNTLTNILDNSQNITGYEGGGNFISYDLNGNMTDMIDKGISSIKYNYLNLPNSIDYDKNGNELVSIKTKYSADGVKLRKENNTSIIGFNGITTNKKTIDYLDGFQYLTTEGSGSGGSGGGVILGLSAPVESFKALEIQAFNSDEVLLDPFDPVIDPPGGGGIIVTPQKSASLQFFPTSEGFYDYQKEQYVYQYLDQVGNIRVSYGRNPGTGQLEILDNNDYYPFGMNHLKTGNAFFGQGSYKNYKFQSQELQELGFYSFKWRNYMPDIGRFFNIDPLSEKYAYQSHYNFSENRVVDGVELEGLEFSSYEDALDYVREHDNATLEFGGPGGEFFEVVLNGDIEEVVMKAGKGEKPEQPDLDQETSDPGVFDSEVGQAVRFGLGFVPGVGSGLDIYEGARDGNWVQLGLGVAGLALDVATLGTGSVIAGGAKSLAKEGVEHLAENVAKDLAQDIAEGVTKDTAKEFAGIGAKKAAQEGEELFNFGGSAGRHMQEPGRAVPVQILDETIKGSKGVADPRGSRALMHSIEMWRNGKPYQLDVLYDNTTNTIWHFQYSPIK